MSFLSKMGAALHKVEGVITQFNPLVGLAVSTAAGLLPDGSKAKTIVSEIPDAIEKGSNMIQLAEAFGQAAGLAGPQKLAAAAGPMAQILLNSAAFAGKKIADPDLFKAGATKIASGLADCLNAVDENEVKIATGDIKAT
jgi:hypothetical protein